MPKTEKYQLRVTLFGGVVLEKWRTLPGSPSPGSY